MYDLLSSMADYKKCKVIFNICWQLFESVIETIVTLAEQTEFFTFTNIDIANVTVTLIKAVVL